MKRLFTYLLFISVIVFIVSCAEVSTPIAIPTLDGSALDNTDNPASDSSPSDDDNTSSDNTDTSSNNTDNTSSDNTTGTTPTDTNLDLVDIVRVSLIVANYRNLAFSANGDTLNINTSAPIGLTAHIKNQGRVDNLDGVVRYYLSTDDTLTPSDTLLGSRNFSSLLISDGFYSPTPISIIGMDTPGTYYYGVCVEVENQTKTTCEAVKTEVTKPKGSRKPASDFNDLTENGNERPRGIWSDGTTMWVVDNSDAKIYAYNMATKLPDSSQDFNTLDGVGNDSPTGIWSDGTNMWVADNSDSKIYAYNLVTKQPDSAKDFDTLTAASNTNPTGIWSDGSTMWVADSTDGKAYAYNLTTKRRDSSKGFNDLTTDTTTNSPRGIFSDGTTLWVVNYNSARNGKLYAYNLATRARDKAKDFNTLAGGGNGNPYGLWLDGTTMWVTNEDDDKIYAYNLDF